MAMTLRMFSAGGDLRSAVRCLGDVIAALGQHEPTVCKLARYWKINTLHEIVLTFDPAVRGDFDAVIASLAEGWNVRDGEDEASAIWAKERGSTQLKDIEWISVDYYIPSE